MKSFALLLFSGVTSLIAASVPFSHKGAVGISAPGALFGVRGGGLFGGGNKEEQTKYVSICIRVIADFVNLFLLVR